MLTGQGVFFEGLPVRQTFVSVTWGKQSRGWTRTAFRVLVAQLCFPAHLSESRGPERLSLLLFRNKPGWDQVVGASLTSHLLEFRLVVKNLASGSKLSWFKYCSDVLIVPLWSSDCSFSTFMAGTMTPPSQGYSHVTIVSHQSFDQHVEFWYVLTSVPPFPQSLYPFSLRTMGQEQ